MILCYGGKPKTRLAPYASRYPERRRKKTVVWVYDGDIHRRFSQGVSERCGELHHALAEDARSLLEVLGDAARLPASRPVAEPCRDLCSVHCSGEVSRIKVIDARKEVSIGEYNR